MFGLPRAGRRRCKALERLSWNRSRKRYLGLGLKLNPCLLDMIVIRYTALKIGDVQWIPFRKCREIYLGQKETTAQVRLHNTRPYWVLIFPDNYGTFGDHCGNTTTPRVDQWIYAIQVLGWVWQLLQIICAQRCRNAWMQKVPQPSCLGWFRAGAQGNEKRICKQLGSCLSEIYSVISLATSHIVIAVQGLVAYSVGNGYDGCGYSRDAIR